MKPLGRGRVSGAVIANQLAASSAFLEALGHCHPDRFVGSRSRVASHKPEYRVVLVALAEELSEGIRVLYIEHPLRMLVDVPRLGDDQPHPKPQLVGPVDDIVYVLEERFVRLGGVAVDERGLSEKRGRPVRM